MVFVTGAGVGSFLSLGNANDRCVPHRLGCGHEWLPCPRSMEWPPSHMAHQVPGDAGCILSTEILSPRPERSPCVGAHQQHISGLLYQSPTRSVFTPLVQAGAPDPCVVPAQTPLAESSAYSWAPQYGSRHPVETGTEARGMDASPRGSGADLDSLWPSSSGPLCNPRDIAMSPLVLSDSYNSAGAGCHGTDLAEASSVRFSTDCSAPRSSRESAPEEGPSTTSSPVLAGLSMVLRPDFPSRRLSIGDSCQEGSPLTGGGHHLSLFHHLFTFLRKLWVWPLRGHNS